MKTKINAHPATIIFDNGGGITLQLGEYACNTQSASDAAGLYIDYQRSGETEGWDGCDEDSVNLEPTDDEIRNGGYRVLDADEIAAMIGETPTSGWRNIDAFFEQMAKNMDRV